MANDRPGGNSQLPSSGGGLNEREERNIMGRDDGVALYNSAENSLVVPTTSSEGVVLDHNLLRAILVNVDPMELRTGMVVSDAQESGPLPVPISAVTPEAIENGSLQLVDETGGRVSVAGEDLAGLVLEHYCGRDDVGEAFNYRQPLQHGVGAFVQQTVVELEDLFMDIIYEGLWIPIGSARGRSFADPPSQGSSCEEPSLAVTDYSDDSDADDPDNIDLMDAFFADIAQ